MEGPCRVKGREGRESGPFVDASRRSQTASLAQEAVTTNEDGGVTAGGASRGRGCSSCEVATDHGVRHDDRLAAEHDVLGPYEGGLSIDLVARILQRESDPNLSHSRYSVATHRLDPLSLCFVFRHLDPMPPWGSLQIRIPISRVWPGLDNAEMGT